jgi:hypothetical protein
MSHDRTYSEKRDYIRMRIETTAILHHAGQETPAVCKDLSSTGMQLEADVDIAVGDKVSVSIQSEHERFPGLHAEAQVVRVNKLDNGKQSIGLLIEAMK